MPDTAINLQAKLSGFSEHWSPRVVAEMNDYQFKLAKILGEFVWHAHEETDEVFIVLSGEMTLEFRDRAVPLATGEMYVVPRGVEHRPVAREECSIMLVEPRGVINTGDAPLRLYTLYGPPEHRDGTVHKDKEQAERDHENDHWNGETTE